MFRRLDDFLQGWQYEADATLKLMDALTDASLQQRVAPEGRSLGFLAWHLATSIPEMMNKTGLAVEGAEHGPAPQSAREIREAYARAAQSLVEQLQSRWSDGSLDDQFDMYGERWTGGQTLAALVAHQAHHRGQMTVLMRQAGLRVPGVYGPAREEWAAMGMAPME
jgi:uncharacterized damage-inducible protein DinB